MNELNAVANKLYGYEPQLYPEDVWDENLQIRIGRLKVPGEPFPGDKQPYALALKAGLLLWDEALDASHTISQNVHNRTGSYWHGLMHRMEGDYSNAKYWFRETGSHPHNGTVWTSLRQSLAYEAPGRESQTLSHARTQAPVSRRATHICISGSSAAEDCAGRALHSLLYPTSSNSRPPQQPS
jgi:hypothetical protein